jgi:hypothetical protein
MRRCFFILGRDAKEVVGIDHLFCFSLVPGSARRPTDAAFRNFTEPMKAFAEMSGGTAAVWKWIGRRPV